MDTLFRSAKYLIFSFYRRKSVIPLPELTIPYMDLTYLLEGSMEYYLNGEKILLHAGDAILYPPGSVRKRTPSSAPAMYASFNILFPNDFQPLICGHLPNCIRSNTPVMLEAFKKEFTSVSAHKQEKCASIFAYLYYQLIDTVLDIENPHIKKAKQYIAAHLSEPLTLERIADAVHLAPQYLCSLFKKHTSGTVVQYITEERIDFAKRMIITQANSLYEIAELCGFGDYNYFSKTFKKITGTTASQYRKAKLKIN